MFPDLDFPIRNGKGAWMSQVSCNNTLGQQNDKRSAVSSLTHERRRGGRQGCEEEGSSRVKVEHKLMVEDKVWYF